MSPAGSIRKTICSPSGCVPPRRSPPSRRSSHARRSERLRRKNVVPPRDGHAMRCFRLSFVVAAIQSLAAVAIAPCQAQTAAPVNLRILAINDFHGNLRPPPGGIRITDPDDNTRKIAVAAGGAEHMATLVRQLREQT